MTESRPEPSDGMVGKKAPSKGTIPFGMRLFLLINSTLRFFSRSKMDLSQFPPPALAGRTEVEPLTNPVIISDLHLSPTKPKTIMAFVRFMKSVAPRYPELVILGDLFDFWLGDDAHPEAKPVMALLKLHAATGRRVLVMPGNRDFVLGEGFAQAIGAELLRDPVVVEIKGRKVLLAHGDEWCLRDTGYQNFRKLTHDPVWQAVMLKKSVAERIEVAKEARSQSETDKTQKSMDVMDVVEGAVAEAAKSAGVDLVIHGHTHRPAAHVFDNYERWVIPDWKLDGVEGAGKSGCITFLDNGRPQIQMF